MLSVFLPIYFLFCVAFSAAFLLSAIIPLSHNNIWHQPPRMPIPEHYYRVYYLVFLLVVCSRGLSKVEQSGCVREVSIMDERRAEPSIGSCSYKASRLDLVGKDKMKTKIPWNLVSILTQCTCVILTASMRSTILGSSEIMMTG